MLDIGQRHVRWNRLDDGVMDLRTIKRAFECVNEGVVDASAYSGACGMNLDTDLQAETKSAFATRAERSSPERALEILSRAGRDNQAEPGDELSSDLAL